MFLPVTPMGVLQDVHWYSGMIGDVSGHTSNLMSAQFFEAA